MIINNNFYRGLKTSRARYTLQEDMEILEKCSKNWKNDKNVWPTNVGHGNRSFYSVYEHLRGLILQMGKKKLVETTYFKEDEAKSLFDHVSKMTSVKRLKRERR